MSNILFQVGNMPTVLNETQWQCSKGPVTIFLPESFASSPQQFFFIEIPKEIYQLHFAVFSVHTEEPFSKKNVLKADTACTACKAQMVF